MPEPLTRREFFGALLYAPSAIAGGLELAVKNNADAQISTQKTTITFEQVLANPHLRQEYLNQLIGREFGEEAYKCVNKFVYDHDGNLYVQAKILADAEQSEDPRFIAHLTRLLNEPNFQKTAVDSYVYDERFKQFDGIKRRDRIIDFLKTEEGIKDYIKTLKDKSKPDQESFSKYTGGSTISNKYDFGLDQKSDVYLSSALFEGYESDIDGKKIFVLATEERIIGTLRHETRHSKNHFYGIKLDADLEINNSNFPYIDLMLMGFIDECRGWLDSINYTRSLNQNRSSTNYLYGYHPAYLDDIIEFEYQFSRDIDALRKKQLSSYDKKLFGRQSRIVMPVLKEAQKVLRYIKRGK